MLCLIPFLRHPILDLGIIAVDAWTICVALSFVLGVALAKRAARRQDLDPEIIRSSAPWIILGGFTGGHLVHVLLYEPDLLRQPWTLLLIWNGLSSFGGFLGAAVALHIHLRRQKRTFIPWADALTLGFVPAWTLARFGCFLAHDHIGKRSDFFLAVDFPGGPRHDLGLYEALYSLLWTVVIYAIARYRPARGTIAALTCIAYAVVRFPMDFLRATDIAGADRRYAGFTPAQYGAVVLLFFGLWLFRKASKGSDVKRTTEAERPVVSTDPQA